MRWVCSLATLSTLLVSSIWSNADVESRVSLLECKMKAAHDDTVYDCRAGARFASGRPFLNSYGFWAVGNVLYWTAYEGGTELAYFAQPEGGLNIPTVVKPVNFEWDVGYRLGIGWVAPHDNMEIQVLFTRIEPIGERTMDSASPNSVNGVILPNLSDVRHASVHWNLKYSALDIELGRAYFLSRYFYMRPYLGSRTAWVMQSANVNFSGNSVTPLTGHFRNDFTGSGLRIGSDSKWFFARHWNLFVGASASALYGKFTVANGENQAAIVNGDLAASLYRIAPMAQTQIGLGWETNFSCDSNQLAINIGYELNYLWRQNQLPAFEHLPTPSPNTVYGARQSKDLAFHGMTVDIELAF